MSAIGYGGFVVAAASTGRDNPLILGAQAPFRGAFFVHGLPMVGDAGQPQGWPCA